MAVLLMLAIRPWGFRNRDLRPLLAQLLGEAPDYMTPGKTSYDLRRLRAHGLIERIEGTNRYLVTERGLLISSFLWRMEKRVIAEGLSETLGAQPPPEIPARFRRATRTYISDIDRFIQDQLAA